MCIGAIAYSPGMTPAPYFLRAVRARA